MGFILDDPVLSDEEYERFREAWIKLDPRLKVVITQPMAYIPFRDPGDEANWIDRLEYDRTVTHEQAEELREELERDAEVDALLVEQDYLCAICGNPLVKDFDSSSPIVTLAHQADHDHKTGQKRGLLCSSCNGGLGFFRDNPTLLRLAAFYLESYK
jgi:hypothetical protein